MTGRATRPCDHQQSVGVAVGNYVHHVERVPGGFAFLPQALLAAAVEHGAFAGQRLFERVAIHVGKHQHGTGVGVLHDGGHQACALVEIDRRNVQGHNRTSMPEAASVVLRSGIAMVPE